METPACRQVGIGETKCEWASDADGFVAVNSLGEMPCSNGFLADTYTLRTGPSTPNHNGVVDPMHLRWVRLRQAS
jgi:hypothetical protein